VAGQTHPKKEGRKEEQRTKKQKWNANRKNRSQCELWPFLSRPLKGKRSTQLEGSLTLILCSVNHDGSTQKRGWAPNLGQKQCGCSEFGRQGVLQKFENRPRKTKTKKTSSAKRIEKNQPCGKGGSARRKSKKRKRGFYKKANISK